MNTKKLLFTYVEKSHGFYKQGFNFSASLRFRAEREADWFVLQKMVPVKKLPHDFWAENISDINMIIGNNGSGKTTIMQIVCQWVCRLSKGEFPQEEGMLVFQENDRLGCIAFANGQISKKVRTSMPGMEFYDRHEIMEYFSGLRLVYFSNTISDMNLDAAEILTDFSLTRRLNQAAGLGHALELDIIDNYKQYEFIRLYDVLKNSQSTFLSKVPIKYIQMEIRYLSFEEIGRLMPKQFGHTAKDLEELWKNYFGICQKKSDAKDQLLLELLQAVFIGILVKLLKWEQMHILSGETGIAAEKINAAAAFDWPVGNISELAAGCDWVCRLFRNLFSECRAEYANTGYQEEFNEIWTEETGKNIDDFIRELLYNKNEISRLSWEYVRTPDEVKSIRRLKLNSGNIENFGAFWEKYRKLVFNVENICFDWNVSSGERNKAGLLSLLLDMPYEEENIWYFLDEPDNTYHVEWKRELAGELNELLKKRKDKQFQVWIATHSPMMLSDMPGLSVIYLRAEKDQENYITKKENVTKADEKTFGQNIYYLLNHAFYLKKGITGTFTNEKIFEVVKSLKEIESSLLENPKISREERVCLEECEKMIELVAEPLFKAQMQEYLKRCKKLAGMEYGND